MMINADMTYQKILLSLKAIVEGLLGHRIANVWSIYGGLNRLHWAMERIFKNGCKVLNDKGEPDCWTFISGLSLLQPSLSLNLENMHENISNLPEEIYNDKAMLWIYKCLEEHSLSDKLNCLISNSKHLEMCYYESAYLRQKQFAAATILCLRAVEQNQPALLAEMDPSLDLGVWQAIADIIKTLSSPAENALYRVDETARWSRCHRHSRGNGTRAFNRDGTGKFMRNSMPCDG